MPRKSPTPEPRRMPKRRELLVRLFASRAYSEPSDAFRLWRTCERRACRRRRCCTIDIFEDGPPPCVMTWDRETLRAACLNLSGLIDGVALGGMLFGPPPPNARASAHFPDDDDAPDDFADMPWDFE